MLRFKFQAGTVFALLCVAPVFAQDVDSGAKPAMSGDNVALLQTGASTDAPDNRPLAGAQNLSLGSASGSHSFLLPSFGITTQLQVTPDNSSSGQYSRHYSTYLTGRLALNKISAHSELLLDYLAGGGFSSLSSQENSLLQNVDVAETIRVGRWQQMFGEQFSYLPSSAFNFSGLGGLNNFGVALGTAGVPTGFRQDLIPNQTIFTSGADRISNTGIAQTNYLLTRRASVSVFGAYSNLHFRDHGFLDTSTFHGGAGFNYLLSPLNSMSISYEFSRLWLAELPTGIDNHSAELTLARRITGKLSAQVGAGPVFQEFRAQLAGSSTRTSWTLHSAFLYQSNPWESGFDYLHALTGGSGVLPGAETDMFSVHLSRTLGNWRLAPVAGYARNSSLRQTSVILATSQGWFVGGTASRQFVGLGSLFISYNAAGQSGLAGICPALSCQTGGVTHVVSVGYSWGFHPIALE